MENTVKDLTLQKDISSFSSFYKTQTSLLNDNGQKGGNVEERTVTENINKHTEDDDSKTAGTVVGVNIDNKTENNSDINNKSDDNNVKNDSRASSNNENKTEVYRVDDQFGIKPSPVVQTLLNNASERTDFENKTLAIGKENEYDRDMHERRWNEATNENAGRENIRMENSPVYSKEKPNADLVTNHEQTEETKYQHNDHQDKGVDDTVTPNMGPTQPESRTKSESDNINCNMYDYKDTEEKIATKQDKGHVTEDEHAHQTRNNDNIVKLQKETVTSPKISSNGISATYERNSNSEANSFTQNLKNGQVNETYDKYYDRDQMPEFKQAENKDNSFTGLKETLLVEEKNVNKVIEMNQEGDLNEVSERSVKARNMLVGETSEMYRADTSKMPYKNNEDETQDEQNESVAPHLNNTEVGDCIANKGVDFENSSERNELSLENKYFTGRLPTLISRNESILMTSAKEGNFEKDSVGKVEKSNSSQSGDELNNSVEKRSMKSQNNNFLRKKDAKSTGGKPLSPTRHIQELLQEIKEPPQSQIDRISNRFPDAILTVEEANKPKNASGDNEDNSTVEMTVDDINEVASKVLGTNHIEEHHSRFDNMPQIKQIDEYVKQSKKTDQEPQTNNSTANKEDVISKDSEGQPIEREMITENSHDKLSNHDKLSKTDDQLPRVQSSKKQTETDSTSNKVQFEGVKQFEKTSTENKLHYSQNVNSSSTENDLKAIIASAKVAISSCTETTESHFDFGTTDTSSFTLQDNSVSRFKKGTVTSRTSSKGRRSTTSQSDHLEALTSLICSNCLQTDTRIQLSGYCTNCQQYLCNTCISVHNANGDTRQHEIVPSYCKNELAINKYVQATGYCADCSMFLCMKCVVQHCGFRANRHHKIIQSSFVSKPTDRNTEANEFLDKLQDKLEPNARAASSDTKKDRKKKRKLLADLDKSNHYSSPFKHVPESLYPGPNKKVSQSYTKHPKWAHSSIPNLPYLVQPKPIPDRVFHAAGQHRPIMIYTKPKTSIDAIATKYKSLKSRYKVKDSPKTARRREQALFTARPLKSRDGYSLLDVDSVKSFASGTRTIKAEVVQNSKSAVKTVEFINEHCLSIPFPRGEKRTDILAMAILMDGKFVVLDKNNNNIKLFNKSFHCTAALQFQNRLMDICASNLCPTDVYAATPKHIFEVSAIKGMDISRKMKIEIKRIEGIASWKYGVAVISKKTNITWELRLLDYRGNLKSKLEIFNPFTQDIATSSLHHMTSSRGGKFITISDSKNSCIITVDVTTRVVVHETILEEGKHPTFLTSDGEGNHNLYVSCDNKVFQISRKGKVVGVLIDKAKENGEIGCIIYNKLNNRMYIKTAKDIISEYQIYL